jgi:GTP-binding protein LepA
VSLVRVKHGVLRRDRIVTKSTGKQHQVDGVGIFTPKREERTSLRAGEVGYVIAGIKDIHGAPVGDTLVHASHARRAVAAGIPAGQAAGLRGDLHGLHG